MDPKKDSLQMVSKLASCNLVNHLWGDFHFIFNISFWQEITVRNGGIWLRKKITSERMLIMRLTTLHKDIKHILEGDYTVDQYHNKLTDMKDSYILYTQCLYLRRYITHLRCATDYDIYTRARKLLIH